MDELIFTRRRRDRLSGVNQIVVKVNKDQYNKVIEVADETGRSIRDITSQMIDFAYAHIRYENPEPVEPMDETEV